MFTSSCINDYLDSLAEENEAVDVQKVANILEFERITAFTTGEIGRNPTIQRYDKFIRLLKAIRGKKQNELLKEFIIDILSNCKNLDYNRATCYNLEKTIRSGVYDVGLFNTCSEALFLKKFKIKLKGVNACDTVEWKQLRADVSKYNDLLLRLKFKPNDALALARQFLMNEIGCKYLKTGTDNKSFTSDIDFLLKRLCEYSTGKPYKVDLSDESTLMLTYDKKKLVNAMQDVKRDGFVFDKTNHITYFLHSFGICIPANGFHHITAGAVLKSGSVQSMLVNESEFFENLDVSSGYWIHNGINTGIEVSDPKIAMLFLLCKSQIELSKIYPKCFSCTPICKCSCPISKGEYIELNKPAFPIQKTLSYILQEQMCLSNINREDLSKIADVPLSLINNIIDECADPKLSELSAIFSVLKSNVVMCMNHKVYYKQRNFLDDGGCQLQNI